MTQKLDKNLPDFKVILLYGAVLGGLLALLAMAKYQFLVADHATELYILLIALVFTAVGIWAGLRWSAPTIIEKPLIVEVPLIATDLPQRPKAELLSIYGISTREWEVLTYLSKGLTNEEIAGKLFVSTNTIKTHLANVYGKLDVKRRTQAIEKARAIGLIAR